MGPDNNQIRNTLIDLSVHAVLTLLLAGYFYYHTGSWVWAVLSVIGGIFIDVDHFIDHFLYFGTRFDLMSFLKHEHLASGKCYVFLHSWELLGMLWFFSVFVKWLFPVAAGMTCHMMVDSLISNRANLMSLSLIYRWRHAFNVKDPYI